MRSRILSILLMLLAVGKSISQTGGTTPPMVKIPWNNYLPMRIPNNFITIVGRDGTQRLLGPNVYSYDFGARFTLPWSFMFIGIPRPQVSIFPHGHIGFRRGTFGLANTISATYELAPSPSNNVFDDGADVLMPYWSDLKTTSVGGVYFRDEGTAPNRVMTFEWRVEGQDFPWGNPGAFQAKLFENPPGKIEFHYGPNSITRTRPTDGGIFGYGAVIGIKQFGQGFPNRDDDSEKFLLMMPPTQIPDTIAITRLRTLNMSSPFFPEYFSHYSSYVDPFYLYRSSPYFHYDFPSHLGEQIGFRMVPVFDDAAVDSVMFTPVRIANIHVVGSTVTVQARFKNIGRNPRRNVPVDVRVYRDRDFTHPVAVLTGGMAFPEPTAQMATSTTTLGSLTIPLTNVTGVYTVEVNTRLTDPPDQDRENDTARGTFYIAKPNDLMPWEIVQPISNRHPMNYQYPVGAEVPIEVRFLNIGTNTQYDAKVGYRIVDEGMNTVGYDVSTIVRGEWKSSEFRDVNLPTWRPTRPGRYYLKVFTMLEGDDNPQNDTTPIAVAKGLDFEVNYENELEAVPAGITPHSPREAGEYPDGRRIRVSAGFRNNGISDATNVRATVRITDPRGRIVYDRTTIILSVEGGGRTVIQEFPDFVPNGSGSYCVTAVIFDDLDPIAGNNSSTWCFAVKPRYQGLVRVGRGEQFGTIREAWDSVALYGVAGPLTLELVDDSYTVAPHNNDPSQPALDMRGRVAGLGPANPVTWRPHPSKTEVRIDLKSPSGIGIWYGQLDTSNPSGYIIWDGGLKRALRFVLENTTAPGKPGYHDMSVPFFLGQGASNYTIRNVRIEPFNAADMRKSAAAITAPTYNRSLNSFGFSDDLSLGLSAGVLLRNSPPIDHGVGLNVRNLDTIRNQNNTVEGNIIRDFAYGVASIGIGPLYVTGTGGFVEYANRNNIYRNNEIYGAGRAGMVLMYEKGSKILENRVKGTVNGSSSVRHAAGIWLTGGDDPGPGRGYCSDIVVERNIVEDVTAASGTGAGIWMECNENTYVTPSSAVFRFPGDAVTGFTVRNNMVSFVKGGALTVAIGLTSLSPLRTEYVTTGNAVDNNSIYTSNSSGTEYGIQAQRSHGSVQNNIIALAGTNSPTGVVIAAPDHQKIVGNYNLFWIPNGNVGSLQKLSTKEGFVLPSPPVAKTLNQWRYLGGQEMNSTYGNITGDFVSTTPGAVDLHIRPSVVGSVAGNRGTKITGMTIDIDNQPRGGASVNGRYDIGADEFTGAVRNNDVMAEDVFGPVGYRATTGRFSDAEYVMTGTTLPLSGVIRNVGGTPQTANQVTLTVQRWTGSTWVTDLNRMKTASVDVSEQRTVAFDKFSPQTLKELGQTDPYYGMHPNVSPLYRVRLRTGTDDNAGNNIYEKEVRFFVRRSEARQVLVSVENYTPGNATNTGITNVTTLGNKLNADTLLAALDSINWERADGIGAEDFDLFERDKWPKENLDFRPWKTIIWAQGEETQGLEPEERAALKVMLEGGAQYRRTNLIMAGQEVARRHDLAPSPTNGGVADRDFVHNYLRSRYVKPTDPVDYSGLLIQGVAMTPGKYEPLRATGVAGDLPPTPAILSVVTSADGVAKSSHQYVNLPPLFDHKVREDTTAGVVANGGQRRTTIYYAFDWRHAGWFFPEPRMSGARRLLLAALEYIGSGPHVVPVQVEAFVAYQSGLNAVTVKWRTAMEAHVSHMRIERAVIRRTDSGETVGEFSQVDSRTPSGSATTGASYHVTDQTVEHGTEYEYRLLTIDVDGARHEDASQRVKLSPEGSEPVSISVVPNPARESAGLVVRSPERSILRVVVHDEKGARVLVMDRHEVESGETVIPLELRDLPSGRYMVRVETQRGEDLIARFMLAR